MVDQVDFYLNEKKDPLSFHFLEDYFSEEIVNFHQSLPGYTITPLKILPKNPMGISCGNLFLKDESKRLATGAFKALGASWAIHSYLQEHPGKYTFCTATDGNHGRAVAWTANKMGHKSLIFMPSGTVKSRIKAIEKEHANVIIIRGNYDEAVKMASLQAEKKNHILIQDTSWPGYTDIPNRICAGYTTLFRETDSQIKKMTIPPPEYIILQSGVGSFAAAGMLYMKKILKKENLKIIVSEPFESDCLLESAKKGKISTTRKSQKTLMAGLNCGTPSLAAWYIIREYTDAFVSVDDNYTIQAVRYLHNAGYATCESGAAGLATLLALYTSKKLKKLREHLKLTENSRFLIINTEGITDPVMYNKIITEK